MKTKAKMKDERAKSNRRCGARAEGKACLHYAEPRGGKDRKAGLTDAAEREQRARLACTMPSREEEKTAKQG